MEAFVVAVAAIGGGVLAWKYRNDVAADATDGAEKIVCPHCQTAGHITIRLVSRKKGVSGGKATGALATGGASMFLTGLSRKENARHLTCGNCKMEWDVA